MDPPASEPAHPGVQRRLYVAQGLLRRTHAPAEEQRKEGGWALQACKSMSSGAHTREGRSHLDDE